MCKLKKFYNISIKGRFAYVMCCVENAIFHYGFDVTKWAEILTAFWKYTGTVEECDEWCEAIWAYIPSKLESLQKDGENLDHYEAEMLGYYDKIKYERIKNTITTNSNKIVNGLLECAVYVVAQNICTSGYGLRKNSLSYIFKAIRIMRRYRIDLPLIDMFKKHEFDPYNIGDENANSGNYISKLDDEGRKKLLCYAFGLPFDGTQYSKILNNPAWRKGFCKSEV